MNTIAVVGVVLGGVDAPLGGNTVRAAGRVVKRDGVDVVAMDGFSGFKTATAEELPEAARRHQEQSESA